MLHNFVDTLVSRRRGLDRYERVRSASLLLRRGELQRGWTVMGHVGAGDNLTVAAMSGLEAARRACVHARIIYAQFKLRQLEFEFPASWGGQRDNAGRKGNPRGNVPHRRRERHRRAHPVHVTLRARRGLPPLREQVIAREIRRRIAQANRSTKLRDVFRIVHFSAQNDHVHLIVEALDAPALSRGVQGLAIRLARRVNKLLALSGRFWSDRFHSRELTTPRSVRNAIVYVLMNAKKHMRAPEPVDDCSSAPWFEGFTHGPAPPREESPVRRSAVWLGSTGWKRHGLVRLDERPRSPN